MIKITNLNEILSDWAYRVDGGMPDATKISHLVILEKTLIECGWNVAERYELIKNLQEVDKKIKWKDKDGKDRETSLDTIKQYKRDDDFDKNKNKQIAVRAAGLDDKDAKSKDDKSDTALSGDDGDFDRDGGKSKPKKKDDKVGTKEVKSKNALKVKQQLDNLDGPDVVASNGKTRRENAEDVMRLVDLYDNAETDDEKRDALKAMADSKLFSKTAPGLPKTKKFYIGELDATGRKMTKDKDHPKGYGRIDPTTGLSYDLIGGKNAKAFANKINRDIDRLGNPGIKMVGELVGRKRMAGDNLLRGQAGIDPDKDAPTEEVNITKTKTGVIIGKTDTQEGFVMDYITETLSDDELRDEGLSEDDIKKYRGQVDLHNQRVERFAKSDKFEAFQILDPETGKPLNPATVEGRRKSVSAITSHVKKRFENLLGEELSDELKSALDNLEKEADDYASGKTRQGKNFRKSLNELFAVLVADEGGRPAAADFAETHALLTDLSMGRYAVLPSKSNFAVGDVISASMITKLDKSDDAETIRNKVKIIITTSKGLTSVKFEKGGASQSANKVSDTEYSDTENATGEEIKEDLKELADPIYEELYSYKNESIGKAKSKTDDIMKKYGLKDYPDEGEEYDESKHIYKTKEIYEGRTKIPEGKYHKRAQQWMTDLKKCPSMDESIPKKDKDGNDLSEERRLELAHEKLVDVYSQVDRAGFTMEKVNNTHMKSQVFTNRILKANINRETKKRETKITETNGLTTLAGMAFSDDPGFEKGCAKPRNKMPSRITTVKKS